MVSRENKVITACILLAVLLAYAPPLAEQAGVPLGFAYPYWLFWTILVGVGIVLPTVLVNHLQPTPNDGRIS